MRKFIVTIDGKNYEVGVEEVLGDQSAAQPAAAPAAAQIGRASCRERV